MPPTTVERKVKVRGFSYLETVENPTNPDQSLRVSKTAARNSTVELEKDQAARGDRLGAFYTDEDEAAAESGGEASGFNAAEAGEDEVLAWLENDDPTVEETVAAAQGDPDAARRILAAEEQVSDGDSRKGVVEGLGTVISRAE